MACKKIVSGLAAIILAAGLLTGCGGTSTTETAESESAASDNAELEAPAVSEDAAGSENTASEEIEAAAEDEEDAAEDEEATSEDEGAESGSEEAGSVAVEAFPETVILEQGGIKVTAEGFGFNEKDERTITVTVANDTASDVKVRGHEAVVDGYEVAIGGEMTAAPGGTTSGDLYLNSRDLDLIGIKSIANISMSFFIDGEGLDDSTYPTAMFSAVTDSESVIDEQDTSVLTELHSADGISVKAEAQAHEDPFGSPEMFILCENETDGRLAIGILVKHADGSSSSGLKYLYPHAKYWSKINVYEGDSYSVKVSRADDPHILEELFVTEELPAVLP